MRLILRDVKEDRNVVQLCAATSRASATVLAHVTADDKQVESTLVRPERRRWTFGLADEGDRFDGALQAP
ncbi:MAG TPA: hypothetical protein PK781_11615, partial [Terrimesophilobacter sp.]|nr:hypothetical protein [Terrimesophilobacter sp.]